MASWRRIHWSNDAECCYELLTVEFVFGDRIRVDLLLNTFKFPFKLRDNSVRSWCDGSSVQSFMGWTH